MKKSPLFAIACITFAGCDITPPSYTSNDWRAIIKAATGDCPDISGTFSIMDEPGYRMLGGHYEEKPKQWSTINISGNPQQELLITLYEAKTGISNGEPIKRVRGKDYQCKDGLLETAWPHGFTSLTGYDKPIPQSDQFERSLTFGKNKMGELVVRGNIRTWQGIAVWCGDGCKYLPIPFTGSTRHEYSRWPTATIPVAKITATALAQGPQETTSLTIDTSTPEGKVAAILNNLLPAQVKLTRLINTANNQWKAVFQGSANGLIALHEELQTTRDIQIIDVQMNRSSAIKEFVTEFRLSPTAEEIAAKKAGEAARLEIAMQHEKEHRELLKKIYPVMPKEMIITASRHDENGMLVEFRHKNNDMFYELLINAIASKSFATADIKTRKPMDNTGKHVVDVLFTFVQDNSI